jgi:hypothetical protein
VDLDDIVEFSVGGAQDVSQLMRACRVCSWIVEPAS